MSSLSFTPQISKDFSKSFSGLVARALQKIIQADPDYLHLSSDLQGASFQIILTEWELSIVFSPDRESGEIKVLSAQEFEQLLETPPSANHPAVVGPDVTIIGRLPAFLGLLRADSSSMVKSNVQIQGDVRVLARYQTFFQRWNIDWGHVLASALGEGPARILYSPLKKISEFLKYQHTERIQDLKEVLYEEKKLLVSQAELEVFYSELKQLQMQFDRLTAKLTPKLTAK
jgi:ubiquinone biosynthesis protein UbiJ